MSRDSKNASDKKENSGIEERLEREPWKSLKDTEFTILGFRKMKRNTTLIKRITDKPAIENTFDKEISMKEIPECKIINRMPVRSVNTHGS